MRPLPPKLGLENPAYHGQRGMPRLTRPPCSARHRRLAVGAIVHTVRGTACISLHASRVCIGAGSELKLTGLSPTGATLEAHRGTLIVASAEEEVRVALPSGITAVVKGATASLEDVSNGTNAIVRTLEGTITVESTDKPPVKVAAPNAIGLRDGRNRPSIPPFEAEEKKIAQLASRWQGSAGAVIEVTGLMQGHIEIDETDIGAAPVSILLDEEEHVLTSRDPRGAPSRETLKLKAGQRVKRGS